MSDVLSTGLFETDLTSKSTILTLYFTFNPILIMKHSFLVEGKWIQIMYSLIQLAPAL